MVTVTQSGQTFTQPQQLAQFWLERKLSGRRIVTVPQRPTLEQDKFWREARTEYAKLRAKPDIRRKFEARVLRRAKPVTTPTAKPTEIPKARPKVDFPEQVKREEIPKFKKLLPIVAKTGERLSIPERAYNLAVSEYNKGVERNDIKRIDRAGFALEAIDKSQIVDKPELTEQEEKRFKRTLGKLKKLPTRDLRGDAVFLQKGVIEKLDLPVRDTGEKRFTPQELFERQMAEQQRIVTTPRVTDELLLGERMLTVEQPSQGTLPREVVTRVTDIEPEKVGLIEFVETSAVVPLVLDKEVYLPDKESRDEYSRLVRQSGKPGTGFTGGRLAVFLEQQKANLQNDLAEFNGLKLRAESLTNTNEFKSLQGKLSRNEATQEEIDKYNKLYSEYEAAFNLAQRKGNTIEAGYKGTGWDLLASKSEEVKRRTGGRVDPTLARGLLKAGIVAYGVEKKILATKVAGLAGANLISGTALGQKALTAVQPVGKVLGSTPVLGSTSVFVGLGEATREFNRSGDLVYTVGAGLGGAGGFFASTFTPSTKTVASKNDLKKLAEAQARGKGYVYKEGKDTYKVVTFQNKNTAKFDGYSQSVYEVRKVNGRYIIGNGKGYLAVVDKKGNIVSNENFEFGGYSQKAPVRVSAGLKKYLANLEGAKSKVVVDIGDDVIKNNFQSLGFKKGDVINAWSDDIDLRRITPPESVRDYKFVPSKKPGIDIELRPKFYSSGFSKNPDSMRLERITKDRIKLLFGNGDPSDDLLSGIANIKKKLSSATRLKSVEGKPIGSTKNLFTGQTASSADIPTRTGSPSGGKTLILESTNQLNRVSDTLGLTIGTAGTAASNTAFSSLQPVIIPQTVSRSAGLSALIIPSQETLSSPVVDIEKTPKVFQQTSIGEIVETEPTPAPSIQEPTPAPPITGTISPTIPATPQTPTIPTTPTPFTPFRPPTRPPRAPRLPDIDLPEFKGKKKIETVPYNAEYLPAGQVKYKQINKKPQTLRSALSTMARKVDETLSNRGRVRKTKPIKTKKGKIVPVVDTKDPYFQNNQFKFRTFDTVRGRRVALPKGNYIERRAFRNDTRGERVSRNKGRRTPFGF